QSDRIRPCLQAYRQPVARTGRFEEAAVSQHPTQLAQRRHIVERGPFANLPDVLFGGGRTLPADSLGQPIKVGCQLSQRLTVDTGPTGMPDKMVPQVVAFVCAGTPSVAALLVGQ